MHSHYLVTWWSPVTVEFQTSNFELVSFGIQTRPKSLLELRRCEEEEICLLQERKVLVEWFAEEWSRLQKAKLNAGKQYYQTLLQC